MSRKIFGIIYILIGIFWSVAWLQATIVHITTNKVEDYSSDVGVTILVVGAMELLIGLTFFTWNKRIARLTLFSLPLLILTDILLNSIMASQFNVLNSIASSYLGSSLVLYLLPVLGVYFVFKVAFKSDK